jgi:integrase
MRGNITRRGRHSWRLKFDVNTSNGQRQTRYVTLKGTRAQAQSEAAKIIASTVTGTYVDASAETVAAFVERWLRDWAAANVSNKTFTRYSELLRLHVAARVGSVPIQKLTAGHLQSIYAAMASEGFAERTRLHVHRALNRLLGHAQQWGVVVRNVAAMVDAPRVKPHEIEVLTAAEVQAVLEGLRGSPLFTIASALLATGLRRGELLALRWQDLDLEKNSLRVEQALEETTRGGLIAKAPKTKTSKRTVSLPLSSVALLREHRKVQQDRLRARCVEHF